MAGRLRGFNPDEVRAGLRLAMSVGLPPVESEQPTFFWSPVTTNTARADETGVPYDVNVRRQTAPARSLRVTCAVEYFDNAGKLENFGVMVPTKVVLTLLDQEYEQVKGFHAVVIGGSRYFYQRTETPQGLGSIGVYSVHCVAEDQA
jgi:hypothetical protein